jgi:hypothetical protein
MLLNSVSDLVANHIHREELLNYLNQYQTERRKTSPKYYIQKSKAKLLIDNWHSTNQVIHAPRRLQALGFTSEHTKLIALPNNFNKSVGPEIRSRWAAEYEADVKRRAELPALTPDQMREQMVKKRRVDTFVNELSDTPFLTAVSEVSAPVSEESLQPVYFCTPTGGVFATMAELITTTA